MDTNSEGWRAGVLQPRLEEPDVELRAARATTHRVARTFSLACRLLPRDVRDDVYRLYLVFRTLDDLVDDGDRRAADRLAALERWCAGEAASSRETRTLSALDRHHDLPRWALADFAAGMRSDLDGRRPADEEELDAYCYRVAGTVGIVMAHVLGFTGEEAEVHRTAAALGMAMQRTNILRDLDEDAGNGRCYVPVATEARLGPPRPGAREALLRDQIARADALYETGLAGIPLLARGRFAIQAAAAMYREILRQIERDGYGRRTGRAVVPRRRKLAVVARAGV
jgi:phytoene synthase